MRFQNVIAAIVSAIAILPAYAADNALLIQIEQDGRFKVWHVEGETRLTEDEVFTLAASARPEGGEKILTGAGIASAFDTKGGIVIEIPGAKSDKALLVERDACGGVKVWHAEGSTSLTDEQLTELVLSALPDGGRTVPVGKRYAKAYAASLGVTVVLWEPAAR